MTLLALLLVDVSVARGGLLGVEAVGRIAVEKLVREVGPELIKDPAQGFPARFQFLALAPDVNLRSTNSCARLAAMRSRVLMPTSSATQAPVRSARG